MCVDYVDLCRFVGFLRRPADGDVPLAFKILPKRGHTRYSVLRTCGDSAQADWHKATWCSSNVTSDFAILRKFHIFLFFPIVLAEFALMSASCG